MRAFMEKRRFMPGDLLHDNLQDLLQGWYAFKYGYSKIRSLEDIQALLRRDDALGKAMDRWGEADLWCISYLDNNYPSRLDSRLEMRAPPLLFGHGPRTLLHKGGLAVVGSRKAPETDLEYASAIGRAAAEA